MELGLLVNIGILLVFVVVILKKFKSFKFEIMRKIMNIENSEKHEFKLINTQFSDYSKNKSETKFEHDVKKILPVLDELLDKLPDEDVDKFSKSHDFKIYERVFDQLKNSEQRVDDEISVEKAPKLEEKEIELETFSKELPDTIIPEKTEKLEIKSKEEDSEHKIDEKKEIDVDEIIEIENDNTFHFVDGDKINDVDELLEKLKTISDTEFHHHVNDERNDFANWIKHSIDDTYLYYNIKDIRNREEMIRIFERHQVSLKY